MSYSIKGVLMERDSMTEDEADLAITDARHRVAMGEDPEEILYEEFCLEPDYMLDLVSW